MTVDTQTREVPNEEGAQGGAGTRARAADPSDDLVCSVAAGLELFGDRWSLLILRDSFRGVRRFDEFRRRLGIARNVLAGRLQSLVDADILERRQYQDRPVRMEYRLTRKGLDLWPALVMLMQWGDRYLQPGEPPVRLRHTACGKITTPEIVCSECGEPLTARDVRAEGPGAPSRDGRGEPATATAPAIR